MSADSLESSPLKTSCCLGSKCEKKVMSFLAVSCWWLVTAHVCFREQYLIRFCGLNSLPLKSLKINGINKENFLMEILKSGKLKIQLLNYFGISVFSVKKYVFKTCNTENVTILASLFKKSKSSTEFHLFCCKEIVWKRLCQTFITTAVTHPADWLQAGSREAYCVPSDKSKKQNLKLDMKAPLCVNSSPSNV